MTPDKTTLGKSTQMIFFNLQILREFGREVKDDPLCSKFIDIPYEPIGIAEKLLPSVPQFFFIFGTIIIAAISLILGYLCSNYQIFP